MFILQVDEPAASWSPPSARAREVTLSTNASHYELQVEIGNDVKLAAQRLFCGRLLGESNAFYLKIISYSSFYLSTKVHLENKRGH